MTNDGTNVGGYMAGQEPARVMMTVKLRSRLPFDELERRYRERMPDFRAIPGLIQKYYVRDEATGEMGGVYVWDSEDSVKAYLASDLRKTIASIYEAEGPPSVEKLEIVDILR